jgi:hypothetical protein
MADWTQWNPTTAYRVWCPRIGCYMHTLVHTENLAREIAKQHDEQHARKDAENEPQSDEA